MSKQLNPSLVNKYFKDIEPEYKFKSDEKKLSSSITLYGILNRKTSGKNKLLAKSLKSTDKLTTIKTNANRMYDLFYDDNFPPNNYSLVGKTPEGEFLDPDINEEYVKLNKLDTDIEWMRIDDILKNQEFDIFSENISPSDVEQGLLGNCYFLSVLAALSIKPYLIFQLFRIKKKNNFGYYEVVMYIDGWQVIFIDDYFPVFASTKKPCFASPVNNTIWVMILEKAWAKVNGGYLNTVGGNPSEPLHALTGFSTECLFHDKIQSDKIWSNIKFADDSNKLICATTIIDKNYTNGLIPGHAYTIIDAKEFKNDKNETTKLLKIRNPWGVANWKGEWRFESYNWTNEIKKEIHYSNDEGTFYITINEFFECFNASFICHIMYDSKVKCYHLNKEEYFNHPIVFNLYLEEETKVALSVVLRNWRFNRKLKNLERPFSLVIAHYNSKREVQMIDGAWTAIENLEFVKVLSKGFYCIWLYCPYNLYKEVDKPFEYVFRICVNNHFISKYIGLDKSFTLIQSLVVEYTKFHSKEEIASCDSFFISYEDCLYNAGIACLVAINKTNNKLLRIQLASANVTNLNILPPFNNLEKFLTKVPPMNGISVIGMRITYDEIELGLKTKQKLLAYDGDFEEQRFEKFMIVEVPDDNEELNINTFVYTFLSENKAKRDFNITIDCTSFEKLELFDLKLTNLEIITQILDLPQLDDEKEAEVRNEIFWTLKEFNTGFYIGQINEVTKELSYRGAYTFSLGQFIIGYWRNNKLNGFGILYDTDNSIIYEGNFIENKKEGQAKLYFKNGDRYEGNFENNEINGEGTYFWKGGKAKWTGNFVNGTKNGIGVLNTNGINEFVEFENDCIVEEHKDKVVKLEICGKISNESEKMDSKDQLDFIDKIKIFREKDEFALKLFLRLFCPKISEEDINPEVNEIVKTEGISSRNRKPSPKKEYSCHYNQNQDNIQIKITDSGYYMGELNNKGSFNGIGVQFISYLKEAYHVGSYVNGSINGYGEQYDKNQNLIYKGMFENSFYCGKGTVYYSNCDYYEGEFLNNMRHGDGIYYWSDGSSWHGKFKQNRFNGTGKYYYPNSPCSEIILFDNDIIISRSHFVDENDFKGEQLNIIESLKDRYSDIMRRLLSISPMKENRNLIWVEIIEEDTGNIYIGQINNRKEYHGRGCLILSKPISHIKYYIGYWYRDLKYKKGFYYKSDFTLIYEGEFNNDKLDGRGRYYYSDCNYYDGEFKDNLKHGVGIYIWKEGNRWEGEFYRDRFDGKGTLIHSNFAFSEIVEYEIGNLISKSSPQVNNSRDNKVKANKKINELTNICEKEMNLILSLEPTNDTLCLKWSQAKFKNGDYIGEFNTLGNAHGRGCLYIKNNNSYYIGYWKNGLKEGKGKIYNGNNWSLIYEGNFKFDNKQGWGRYFNYNEDKSFYEGDFDEMGCGEGLYVWGDGTHWKGKFRFFKLDGLGKLYNSQGVFIAKIKFSNGENIGMINI